METSPVHEDAVSSASPAISSTTLEVAEVRVSVDTEVETTIYNAHSSCSSFSKPHATSSDPCWNNIRRVQSEVSSLSLDNFCFIQKLGSGDIGSVYLVELKGNNKGGCLFAAKVMDKEELVSRSKEGRARTEREILEMLDHPFLPILYTTLDTDKWSLLLTEFCPGGDLHVLRQRLPEKRFDEAAVRFYTSEVVVALEYLHMMGIIYRDLKPENVLVRSNGHIMLTDFDLSLKCDDSIVIPQLVHDDTSTINLDHNSNDQFANRSPLYNSLCILPNCIVPHVSCWYSKHRRRGRRGGGEGANARRPLMRLIAEPVEARSVSFVGTHEYLAPEIVSGEGHGNAVDWWTLGIFMYELLYGITPFRGLDNEFTLSNIVARTFEFPKEPMVPTTAKDLITQLLVKDPTMRMGSMMGATTIKQHPFFDGVNWALLRCTTPPHIPQNFNITRDFVSSYDDDDDYVDYY